MAAPDLDTLFQQEEQLCKAFCGVLSAPNASLPAFYSFETADKPADHIDVLVELGAATKQEAQNREWNTWDFRAQFTITTERKKDEPAPTRHAKAKGATRKLLSRLSGKFTSVNLPYLQILELRPSGTQIDFRSDNNIQQDVTTLEYAGQVAILATAWP